VANGPLSRSRKLRGVLAGTLATVAAVAAGCGGEGDRVAAAELATARAEARREVLSEQRVREAASETKRLRREVEKLMDRADADAEAARGREQEPRPRAATSAPSSSSCGDGVEVNATTSCAFARNVRDAFEDSGGGQLVEAYSPVTGRAYLMRCAPGVPTRCVGGRNAVVLLR